MGMLDDLFVLDLSRVLAGPYCTLLFADLGRAAITCRSTVGRRAWSST